MLSLVTALGIGLLLASPQLVATLRYYPTTIRTHTTYADKVRSGNLSFSRLFQNLFSTRSTEMVDGLHYPEGVCYVGLIPLGLMWFSHEGFWWMILLISVGLAMGKRGMLFYRTHWVHLRHPVRYCYFISLALVFLSMTALNQLSSIVGGTVLRLFLLLQAWDLLMNTSHLLPMEPYVQRWERPEIDSSTHPLALFLSGKAGRVSGLPYPLRTGQLHHIQTLGYNGGAQPKWMARFREDINPNGSGASDWFALQLDSDHLDWYGVKYAYTYRPLRGKWKPTHIRHLFENSEAQPPPSWKEVAQVYGNHSPR